MPDYAFPVQGYTGAINKHWGDVNGGSDLFAARGTPVVAMEGGKVIEAGWNSIGGNSVLIQAVDGNQYYYAHFDAAPSVQVGQTIPTGTYLGPVGDTGDAKGTGTHLHLGIGPSILLGNDKYGGTGGNYDAVSLLKQTFAGQSAIPAAVNPYDLAPVQNAAPVPIDYGNQWANRARDIAAENGIDSKIFVKLIKQESNFDPTALNKRSGASGLGQLMPGTAAGLGVTNSFDPESNLQGSAKYLKGLLTQFNGNYTNAVAAYNAGPGAVSQYGGIPPFPETQAYVKIILGDDAPPNYTAQQSMPAANNTTPVQSSALPATGGTNQSNPTRKPVLSVNRFPQQVQMGNDYFQPDINQFARDLSSPQISPPQGSISSSNIWGIRPSSSNGAISSTNIWGIR